MDVCHDNDIALEALSGYHYNNGTSSWRSGVITVFVNGVAFDEESRSRIFLSYRTIIDVQPCNTQLVIPNGIIVTMQRPQLILATQEWFSVSRSRRNDIISLIEHFREAPKLSAKLNAGLYFDRPHDPSSIIDSSNDRHMTQCNQLESNNAPRWFDMAMKNSEQQGSRDSTRQFNMMRLLHETSATATETLAELQRQGEKIVHTRQTLSNTKANLGTADSVLSNMESWLAVFGLKRVRAQSARDVVTASSHQYDYLTFPCLVVNSDNGHEGITRAVVCLCGGGFMRLAALKKKDVVPFDGGPISIRCIQLSRDPYHVCIYSAHGLSEKPPQPLTIITYHVSVLLYTAKNVCGIRVSVEKNPNNNDHEHDHNKGNTSRIDNVRKKMIDISTAVSDVSSQAGDVASCSFGNRTNKLNKQISHNQNQEQELLEQPDKMLGAMSDVLGAVRDMALVMNDELSFQNMQLDTMNHEIDEATDHLHRSTQRVNKLL